MDPFKVNSPSDPSAAARQLDSLKTNIEDLEMNLELNKQMLLALLDFQPNASENDDSDTVLYQGTRSIESIISENSTLEESIRKTIEERNESHGRALINEQIFTEFQRKEQEISQEYEEKLNDIKFQIDRKDRIITELESKKKLLAEEADLHKKNKNLIVVPPTPAILEKHIKVEESRDSMQKVARDLYCAQRFRETLTKKCNSVWEDCIKLHALIKNPVNRKQGVEKQTINNLKTPRRDFSFEFKFDDQDLDSSDDFLAAKIPEKNANTAARGRAVSVPSLDFSKLKPHTAVAFHVPVLSAAEQRLEEKIAEARECVEFLRGELDSYTEELLKISNVNEDLLDKNENLMKKYEKIAGSALSIKEQY